MDINKTIHIGRLTRDPEMRYSQDGKAIASFSIACNGYKQDDTSFFNCVAFGKTAEIIGQYCKKGKQIGIEGRLQQRTWDDKDGNKRSTVEIVVNQLQLLGSKSDDTPPF